MTPDTAAVATTTRAPVIRRRRTEESMQAALVAWARPQPAFALLFHVPNGGERSGLAGGLMVALGARKGVPDLVLPVPVGPYHGLFLELKDGDGRLRPEQVRWLDDLAGHGYAACVAWGLDAAKRCLMAYVGGQLMPREWR